MNAEDFFETHKKIEPTPNIWTVVQFEAITFWKRFQVPKQSV